MNTSDTSKTEVQGGGDGGVPNFDFTTFYTTINNSLTTTPKTHNGIDPSTKTPLPEVPISAPKDISSALSAAHAVFSSRRSLFEVLRAMYLIRLTSALASHRSSFIDLPVL
ncbi:uncharacterized protein BCR38DRAFT_408362 [Pseudomassariella vexata]|uniref:Uncharacterized protein n=1 Tax=Pseudomassariella vexata TaxID=1141098 RepID=A0A1Y2E4G9_9PEZI|nr:uncharacterized protein BCR38DRAFT_408362 [Pseudomassariella vexata]ORY66422.1 hypothetical protein BCR38DRAFT_408362 [Pseudomassariella vexata]